MMTIFAACSFHNATKKWMALNFQKQLGQGQLAGEGFLKHQQSPSTIALGIDSLRSFFPATTFGM